MRLVFICLLTINTVFGQSSVFLDVMRNALLVGLEEQRDLTYQFSDDGLSVALNMRPSLQFRFMGIYNRAGVYQALDEELDTVFVSFRLEDTEIFISSNDKITGNLDFKEYPSVDMVSNTEGLPFTQINLAVES